MITVAIVTTHHSESNEKAFREFKPPSSIFVFYSYLRPGVWEMGAIIALLKA